MSPKNVLVPEAFLRPLQKQVSEYVFEIFQRSSDSEYPI